MPGAGTFRIDLFNSCIGALSGKKTWVLTTFDVIDSTSDELKRRLAGGASLGTVVVADVQTAGRGRQGRQWHSALAENLYISASLAISGVTADLLPMVPLCAGVALGEALWAMGVRDVRLKWPNDLLLRGKKVAGILCEATDVKPMGASVVVGMGVNLGPMGFPGELVKTAATLADEAPIERAVLAARWLDGLDGWLEMIERGETSVLVARWRQLGERFGRTVRVGDLVGETVDLNAQGRLLVRRPDGAVVAVPGGIVEQLESDQCGQ